MTVIDPSIASREGASAKPFPSPRTANWVLFVFSLSLVVNFLDRGIINLLVEPIKRDLGLSDLQVSFLMGFAFVLFYLLAGFPIARLVDSRSRRNILAIGLTCWSVMTAACGLAQNFMMLFLARVGVGVGEACTGPATYSMLSDLYPRERLPKAIAFLNFGSVVGMALALILGGMVVSAFTHVPEFTIPGIGIVRHWQMVFFVVGIPGLLVALLMLSFREPVRRGSRRQVVGKVIPVREVAGFIWENRTVYAPQFFGLAIRVLYSFGAQTWAVTFYLRTYGWEPGRAGLFLGLIYLSTPIGMYVGGVLAERMHRAGRDDTNMRLTFLASAIMIPGTILAPLMPTPWLALLLTLVSQVIGAIAAGPENAAIQTVTPNEMRGQVTALYLFIFNVIGAGLGPTFIAVFTDLVFQDESMLRYAMALSAAIMLPLGSFIFWLGIKPYGRAVARAREWD